MATGKQQQEEKSGCTALPPQKLQTQKPNLEDPRQASTVPAGPPETRESDFLAPARASQCARRFSGSATVSLDD